MDPSDLECHIPDLVRFFMDGIQLLCLVIHSQERRGATGGGGMMNCGLFCW